MGWGDSGDDSTKAGSGDDDEYDGCGCWDRDKIVEFWL